jgi:Acyl-CoA dehydrogenase, C-terminal domain
VPAPTTPATPPHNSTVVASPTMSRFINLGLSSPAATDACYDVADKALQLHGGYGYLREYGLEKIVRDLRVHRILEGTNEIMRVVIGRAEAARVRASA